MWTVPKEEVADLLKLDLLAKLREAREKDALFKQTYEQSFESFEETVRQGEEDMERWDDYIEWKAYKRLRNELERKIDALRRGDFEVA